MLTRKWVLTIKLCRFNLDQGAEPGHRHGSTAHTATPTIRAPAIGDDVWFCMQRNAGIYAGADIDNALAPSVTGQKNQGLSSFVRTGKARSPWNTTPTAESSASRQSFSAQHSPCAISELREHRRLCDRLFSRT